ncbi:hypothetical protein PHMEG_00034154 [Phytophthora megakarya]|uniref:RxLR effector protein n=1 Tax=Phytophthora megakarya TaxID=4795 RepID=A0A225US55_9STRA|nr:hypothetical protein PHMEG_00034154 [Phytophthora megakarya]
MKLLSTLAFVCLAIHFTLAEPERHLLRSGFDTPVKFSDLTDLTPSTSILPSGKGTKNVLPTDQTTTAGRSGLYSTKGGSKGVPSATDKVPSLIDGLGLPSPTTGSVKKAYEPATTDKSDIVAVDRTS